LSYLKNRGCVGATCLGALIVNPGLEIIFNGIFEAQISGRKRAESRFLPGKTTTAVSVYHATINQGAALRKPAPCSRYFYFSFCPHRHQPAKIAGVWHYGRTDGTHP
jgi:hypothetical protein